MPLPRSFEDGSGMLLTTMSALGALTVRSKVALKLGSSHEGTKRRASEFSNWVYSARFLPDSVW
jgi:hypothetical protein